MVFESVTLGVNDGARIGIVGRNGDGKSSLLGVLTGQLQPDSGRVTRRSGLRVGALSQADTLDPGHSVGWTLVGDQPEHQWAGDARVRDVVGGLVSDIAWDATIATLSGGQRRRVQLARLLVGDWDVIALDEPTNHLDIEGITWLAAHLRQRWARSTGRPSNETDTSSRSITSLPSRAVANFANSTVLRSGGTSAISWLAASIRNFGLDVRAGGPRRSQASSLRIRFCRRASLAAACRARSAFASTNAA